MWEPVVTGQWSAYSVKLRDNRDTLSDIYQLPGVVSSRKISVYLASEVGLGNETFDLTFGISRVALVGFKGRGNGVSRN